MTRNTAASTVALVYRSARVNKKNNTVSVMCNRVEYIWYAWERRGHVTVGRNAKGEVDTHREPPTWTLWRVMGTSPNISTQNISKANTSAVECSRDVTSTDANIDALRLVLPRTRRREAGVGREKSCVIKLRLQSVIVSAHTVSVLYDAVRVRRMGESVNRITMKTMIVFPTSRTFSCRDVATDNPYMLANSATSYNTTRPTVMCCLAMLPYTSYNRSGSIEFKKFTSVSQSEATERTSQSATYKRGCENACLMQNACGIHQHRRMAVTMRPP